MRKNNSLIVFAFIGIAIIVLFMITATYAYFSVEIRGTGKDMVMSSFNQDMEITYHDTSNFSLVNAYTGESISKTFDVENTGDTIIYYDIVFTELVNNFTNANDLVYTLTSSNGGINKQQTVVPKTDNTLIGSYIKINSGITHTYTLTVTFLNIEDTQISNMDTKTFSTKVSIKASSNINNNLNIYNTNSLGYAILNNNSPQSDAIVNFNELPTDGLYYNNNSIDGATVYYFRGSTALNNNVLFAGYCWKIIRTTEDLGIRLIYNGPHNNGACTNTTGSSTYTSNQAFNNSYSYNAYVGFKYGSANSSTYTAEHANTNKSSVKIGLDNWYSSNLLANYNSYVADSYYCNNRETNSFKYSGVLYGNKGYKTNITAYNSFYRLYLNNTPIVSFNCNNKLDIFTVTNTRGNASGGSYPIGIITIDEAIFAGYSKSVANSTSYLNNSDTYWTMTPYYFSFSAKMFYINNGNIGNIDSNGTAKVRPVITLKQNTILLSGNGSTSTPYKITD